MKNDRHLKNTLTAEAFATAGAFEADDRTVVTEGSATSLTLHGKPCMELDHGKGTVTLHGSSLPTRKTVRCMNAVLSALGLASRVGTTGGRWHAEDGKGKAVPFEGDLELRAEPPGA